MDPLVEWLLTGISRGRAPRDALASYRETRDANVSDDEFRGALRQARQQERVRVALEGGWYTERVGDLLKGIIAFGDQVSVPVLFVGTDKAGHSVAKEVTVFAGRDDTIADLHAMAQEALEESEYGEGFDWEPPIIAWGVSPVE